MNEAWVALATAFGLGNAPWLPGTAGALPGLVLAWWLLRYRARTQWAVALLAVALAVPVCEFAGRALAGDKDDSRIVADEFMTFPVTVAGQSLARHPGVLIATFSVSRMLDGLKPFPAANLEIVAGGLGVVLDDVVVNLYVWLGLAGVAALIRRRRV